MEWLTYVHLCRLFLFDRDIIEAALAALFIIPLTLCGCLWISYRSLDAAAPNLASQGRRIDVWLVRAFVHNGLGIYATWTAIATLLNLAIVIRYGYVEEILFNSKFYFIYKLIYKYIKIKTFIAYINIRIISHVQCLLFKMHLNFLIEKLIVIVLYTLVSRVCILCYIMCTVYIAAS